MRNLKKILALVLALVMSLSLMATASATDFADAESINDTYETAVKVLEGLGVFKGYQEGSTYNFKPTGTITRAETAAIIYRIVTGDVDDKQVGIYADYNLFSDVTPDKWFAGYVNFCANAEYIKGNGNGTFSPDDQVTGYAALAMILRAIGYTANGGFTGDDWEIQTARTAEARKITKNILTGTLGQPASRETVAEILFQAILVNMVDHNVDYAQNGNQGYYEVNETLGYKTFKLEELEGVVVGNEYADLNSNQVLAEGKTSLQVADETAPRTLNYGTKLTDVGESRLVYTENTSKVLYIADTGKNNVTEFGHACEVETAAKFKATAEMTAASDIQYYVNFDRVGNYTCDQRLEATITFNTAAAVSSFNRYIDNSLQDNSTIQQIAVSDSWTVTPTVGTYYPVTYHKIIYAERDISENDLKVIRGIFGAADNNGDTGNNLSRDDMDGDVYLGTYSSAVSTEDRDISNKISYRQFFADYINTEVYNRNWDTSVNGQWVKFVDNDDDGECEYAFRTGAVLDEVVGTYTNKAGDTVMEYNGFNDDDHSDGNAYTMYGGSYENVRYMDGVDPMERDVEIGNKVIWTLIDNQILVGHANSVTKTVNKYDWKNDIITTTDGDEYGQSLISNATDMLELISTMDEKTEYVMYLDSFDYVRAYELPGGTNYALVTELYYTNGNNGNLVQDWPMTVELWNGANGKDEYSTAAGNVFNARTNGAVAMNTPWTEVRSIASNRDYYNWLQPAISHLGVTRTGGNPIYAPTFATPAFGDGLYTFWNLNNQVVHSIEDLNGSGEFDYGEYTWTAANGIQDNDSAPLKTSAVTTSFTNVAIANISGENANISGAARLKLDNQGVPMYFDANGNGTHDAGERWRYAVDYIQLSTADVAAGTVRYPIDGNDGGAYAQENNYYVNAIHDTEYYIVYNGDVLYFKDYANMPKLTNKDNNIRAAYAVARDTSSDIDKVPYWVADVIVYEIEEYDDSAKSSISLAYYNPSRTTGNVQLLETLNNKSENPMIDVVPTPDGWGADKGSFGNYSGYGFYDLYNTELLENGNLSAAAIDPITKNFNANGIYAGKVVRVRTLGTGGDYLDVNLTGAFETDGVTLKTEASIKLSNNIYSITNDNVLGSSNQEGYNEATPLQYNNTIWSEVKAGDRVLWVGGSGGTGVNSAAFIVDIGHFDADSDFSNTEIYDNTAPFLGARTAWRPDMDPNSANTATNVPVATGGGLPLWRIIYNEQLANVIAAWNITYNVVDEDGKTVTLAVGDSITPTTRLKSAAGDAVEIVAAIAGYDVVDMRTADDAECYMTDGKWYLNNIKEDITVDVTVAAVVDKHTLTVKATGLPTALAIENQTYEIAEDGTRTIDLTAAPYAVEGYEVTTVTSTGANATVTTTPATVDSTHPGTAILVVNPTDDGEITLAYTAIAVSFAAPTLSRTGGATALTAANVKWSIEKADGTAGANGNCGTLPTTAQLAYGDTLTLTWTGAANTVYTVSGASAATSGFTNGALDYEGTTTDAYSISGVVKGAITGLTITASELPGLTFLAGAGVNTAAAAAGSAKITLPAANSIHKGEAVTLADTALVANAGDTILGVTWTQFGADGGSGSFQRDAADNGWEVPAGTINGEGDVIISAKVVTDADCKVTVTNNTGLTLLGAKYDADGDADGAAAAVAAAAVTIKPDGSYVIQAAGDAKLVCTVTAGDTLCTVSGNSTNEITIANVVGTVAIALTVAAD